MLSGGSIHFQPAPEAIEPLLDDLGSPSASIADLARTHNTTVAALCAWMAHPDIAERLAQSDNIITWRTRLVASRNLTTVVATLSRILEDFNSRRASASSPPATPPSDAAAPPPTPFQSLLLAWRANECARKSCALLVRLINVHPVGLPRPLPAATPITADPRRSNSPQAAAKPLVVDNEARTTTPLDAPTRIFAPAPTPTIMPIEASEPSPNEATASASQSQAPASAALHPPEPTPPDTSAQLEDLLFALLQQQPHLEPALSRLVEELNHSEAALATRPP